MRLLLDTHAFLWWVTDDGRLSALARRLLSDMDVPVFLSAASAWEMAIKSRLGKLDLPADLHGFLQDQLSASFISTLPVTLRHATGLLSLPDHHRDPFDRILVSQARIESLTILSADATLSLYPVEVIW